MGIFSSKKGNQNKSVKDTDYVASKKRGSGLKKIFSFMFATTESTEKKAVIDVYSRPTFRKSLEYEPGKGYSSADTEYATSIRCANYRTSGIKRHKYKSFDFDTWGADERAEYERKFIPKQIDDETADMMKMSVEGLEMDAMEIDDFGTYSEADIEYEEVEVPLAKPEFLPEIIREEVEEEPVIETPVEEPKIEEPAQIEAPAVAGLIEEPKIEEAAIEVPAPEESFGISFGFGTNSDAQPGQVTISFGFCADMEVKEEKAPFIESSVLASQDAAASL